MPIAIPARDIETKILHYVSKWVAAFIRTGDNKARSEEYFMQALERYITELHHRHQIGARLPKPRITIYSKPCSMRLG